MNMTREQSGFNNHRSTFEEFCSTQELCVSKGIPPSRTRSMYEYVMEFTIVTDAGWCGLWSISPDRTTPQPTVYTRNILTIPGVMSC